MYIIIGASSFIGVYTANEFLLHGCEIVVTGRNNKFRDYYDKKNVPYINLDLNNKEDFAKLPQEGVEGVILLSGLLPANASADLCDEENADEYIVTNTLGTIYLLEYCRKNNIQRIISTVSFADVQNAWSKEHVITEEEPRNFKYTGDHAVYVISKNAASDIMEYYNQQHNMKNAWFRLPPVYGVGPHGSLLVNGVERKSGLQIFIEKASEGEEIHVFGDRTLSRDVVYVKDVANAFYLAMKAEKTSGLYNITAGHGTTLDEQAVVIREVFGGAKKSDIIYDENIANNGQSYIFSIKKAKEDFGYDPQFSNFKDMMVDYKMEMMRGEYSSLFG